MKNGILRCSPSNGSSTRHAIQLQQLDEGVEQAMHSGKRVEPRLQLEADDEWLDEALQETFPASDPIPLFHKASEMERRGDESPSSLQRPADPPAG